MKKAVSTDLTSVNIAKVKELLADAPIQLENLSRPLSEEQLRQPLGAGERSFTEDLAHLIHTEARSSEAIYLALLMNEPLVPDIHPPFFMADANNKGSLDTPCVSEQLLVIQARISHKT